jgi:hypothetical protein
MALVIGALAQVTGAFLAIALTAANPRARNRG